MSLISYSPGALEKSSTTVNTDELPHELLGPPQLQVQDQRYVRHAGQRGIFCKVQGATRHGDIAHYMDEETELDEETEESIAVKVEDWRGLQNDA